MRCVHLHSDYHCMVVCQNTSSSGSSQRPRAADVAQRDNAICLDSLQIAQIVMLAHIDFIVHGSRPAKKKFTLAHDEICLVFAIPGSVAVLWHL